MKSYLFSIAAALLLTSCSIWQAEPDDDKFVTVNLEAEVSGPIAAKAAITPDGKETSFTSAWSEGDELEVHYLVVDKKGHEREKTVTASWNGRGFSALLPDIKGQWEYSAFYPYAEDGQLDFGSTRTQKGSAYNSRYDVMSSSTVKATAAAGKTIDGHDIVLPMERQTALAYFHFTSPLDEPVVKATLSVTDGYISAGSAKFENGRFVTSDQQRQIDLDVTDQTADDFTLWFNVLPCSYGMMSLVVSTPSHRLVYNLDAGSFDAGSLYKTSVSIPMSEWKGDDEDDSGTTTGTYELVTSTPPSWSGEYLLAYVEGSSAYVFTGEDVAMGSVSTTVSNNRITHSNGMAALHIEAMSDGYSLQVIEGPNSGKYLSGGTSNGMIFNDKPVANSIALNQDGTVKINNNSTTSLQFNSYSDQLRFRYYKSEQKGVKLFKSGTGGSPVVPPVTGPSATTEAARAVELASATLYGSYTNAPVAPAETGFLWGTSPTALTNELYVGMGTSGSGTFSKTLGSLSPATTYFYKAYILIDGQYYYGSIMSFTTANESGEPGVPEAYAASWLAGYEIPATSVSLSSSSPQYEGRYCHSTVSESYGSTKACIYNTSSQSQRIVTHTFSYNGKVLPNYTMLYDQNMHCALWEAFELGGDDYKDNGIGRTDAWGYDPAIPSDWQPNLSSAYKNSYTRGHAVASNYRKTTTDQNKQTFYYSNMTPQTSTLNSGNWNTLEQSIKSYSSSVGGSSRLFVVTGPIFEDGYTTTTDKNGLVCPVPTKYFKCLMLCKFSDGKMVSAQGAGYLYNHSGDLSRQNVTIDTVEALAGFDFFANVPDSLENSAESSSTAFL